MGHASIPAMLPDGFTAPVRMGTDRPRILHVINSLGMGGSERSLTEILRYYPAAGFDASIVCLKETGTSSLDRVERMPSEIRYLSGRHSWGQARELRRLIRSEGADLVHTTLFEADVVGRLAAAGTGVPVITSLVNTSYEPVRLADPNVGRFGLRVTRAIDGWTARHLTTHFHAVSQAVKSASVRALGIPDRKITVVERGRDPDRLGKPGPERRRQARLELGLRDEEEVVVTVGRQEFQKGHRYLLEAMGSLIPRRPRLVALIAGRTGNATKELQDLHRRLGLDERVRFLGHRDDVPDVLAAADLFVFPSQYEGLPGAVIEAMALGLPVVASDIPGNREVVAEGRNALLVPATSSHHLAGAIETLLEDPEKAHSFSQHSRQIFEERFTLRRSAWRMIELFQKVMEREVQAGSEADGTGGLT